MRADAALTLNAQPRSLGRPAAARTGSRNAWSRVWNGFLTLLTLITVLIGVVALVLAGASHFSQPGRYTVFAHPVLVVLSGSMSPAIQTGDLVYDNTLSAAQAGRLHAGQIISFYASDTTVVTHRIHAVRNTGGAVAYQTKGDRNNAPDPTLVDPSRIVGLYVTKIPFGGYVLDALHRPPTLALLLASPLLWLLSTWLFGLARGAEVPVAPAAAAPVPKKRGLLKTAAGTAVTLMTVLVAVLAVLLVALAVAARMSPAGQYTIFGHPVLVVRSTSMSPAANPGDVIVDDPVSPDQAAAISSGQVVTFLAAPGDEAGLTRRIVAVNRTAAGQVSYVTRGDAEGANDQEPVRPDLVVGVMRARVPYAGLVIDAVQRPLVLLLLLAAPLLWLISDQLRRFAGGSGEGTR